MLKRVTFGSFKSNNIKTLPPMPPSRTKVGEFPPGTLIPEEILEERMMELEREQSFEALRSKVKKADEERKRKEELEREIALKMGHLQDHGTDHQLGYLSFKILYDVNREALKVTLIEANHLRPRDPLGVLVNVRVQVVLENIRESNKIITPRGELSMLKKLANNRNVEYAQNSAQKMRGKTMTVDPASSSIFWRTHRPVWNEDFFFENIQNRLLKSLVLVFTLFERAQTQHSQPIRDDFLGEVRIPLSKIHKKLASKGDNNNEGDLEVGGPDQHPINGPSRESLVKNASKEVQSPTETEEAKPQIELPKEKPLGEKEIIARWLASSVSPTPGQDEEFEELQSLCNSEAVHDLLKDPDLMDSVSVRELHIVNSEVKNHLNTIKELTVPVDPEPEVHASEEQTINVGNDRDDSEEDLPADERPFIIRKLEGWHYINRIPGIRPCYGSLEIGLIHEPNLGKITVSIIKGRKMLATNNSFMEITVSVQKKIRICKKSSPLQAIPSIRSGGSRSRSGTSSNYNNKSEPVAITEKPGKIYRTSVRSETSEPVWDDRFTFNVPKEQLLNVTFDILVYHKDEIIGGLRMGHAVSYRASQHWAKMINHPGVWAYCSYILQ